MANVRIDLSYPIVDGQPLTFRAPCDCTSVTGIKVYYPNGETTESKEFTLKDAHCNDLAEIGDLFASGAYVKVIVDTTNNAAYIQNADTNKYLEGMFATFKTSIAKRACIASGSYVGSGKYGEANPNSLTFDFTPKVIMFYGKVRVSANTSSDYPLAMLCDSGLYAHSNDGLNKYTRGNVTVNGNTVSWHTTKTDGHWTGEETDYTIVPYGQMNGEGETYYYVAFGEESS